MKTGIDRMKNLRTALRNLALLALVCTPAAFTRPLQAADIQPTGIIEPFLDVTLSAAVPGIVTGRKCEEGGFIQEGAVLLELDSIIEELEVQRRGIVRDDKKRDFQGTEKLFRNTKGVSKEEVEKKEAELRVAEVEYQMAHEQKRRRQLIAPHAGVITDILIETGEACQPYQPLVRMVDTRRCYFTTNVEPKHGSRLKLQQRVTLEVDLGDGKVTVQGQIVFLSPVVDPASGLQRIKVLFENSDGRVRPGLVAVMISETHG